MKDEGDIGLHPLSPSTLLKGLVSAMLEYLTIEYLTTKELTRIFSNVRVSLTHSFKGAPCWEWVSALRKGYPSISYRNSTYYAHRFFYAWLVAPVAKGKAEGEIDHRCRNPICVNPAHLEIVTTRINLLRSTCPSTLNALKLNCDLGHEFKVTKRQRYCPTCARARYRKRKDGDHEWVNNRRKSQANWRRSKRATDPAWAAKEREIKRKAAAKARDVKS